MMKKNLCIVVVLLIFISLTGCSKQSGGNQINPGVTGEFPVIDDDGFIRIMIPENLLGGKSAEEAIDMNDANAQILMTDYIVNDDGSATFVMTSEQFYQYKENMYHFGLYHKSDPHSSIKEVVYLDNFMTEIDVFVDYEAFSDSILERSMASVGLALYSGQYQIFCGTPADQWHTKITLRDWQTKELIDEFEFSADNMYNVIY